MEIRSLTPRQLLIVVLVACRDAGYDVLSKQKIVDAFHELNSTGERRISRELEQAFNDLHRTGASFDAVENTITVSNELSEAEIYKPLHDREREELALALLPYVSSFVGRMVLPDPNAPKRKPDPRHS